MDTQNKINQIIAKNGINLSVAEFLKAIGTNIEQLYVDNYNDILLIPKVGNHTIVFGSADHIEDKFETLKTFYLKGLNAVGWDQYKKINLKYEGQIVAEKNDNLINSQTTQTQP